jgi:hypothetical protein
MERLKKRFLGGVGTGVVFAVLFLAVGLQGTAAPSQSSSEEASVGWMTFIPGTTVQKDVNTATRTAATTASADDTVSLENWTYTSFWHGFCVSPHAPPHVTIKQLIIDLIIVEIFFIELLEFVILGL